MPSIILKTNNKAFNYSTAETEIKNAIGKVSATLVEYIITACDESSADIFCKLYKTKEGFWYDPSMQDELVDNKTKHSIKAAIDVAENESITRNIFHS